MATIRLEAVKKVFNAGQPNEFCALRGIDLILELGRIIAFTGPSGSGKTTLLTLIGCMARPTSGRIWLEGREITSLPERFLTAIRRRTFGFVFQQFNLVKGVTTIENVMLPAYPTVEPLPALKKRAMALLDGVGLAPKAFSKAEWLSGGEAQRTAIARALINDPSVIIADEPTAHLDTALSHEFMEIMERLNGEGRTVLLSSHDPNVCNSSGVSKVIELHDGAIERVR